MNRKLRIGESYGQRSKRPIAAALQYTPGQEDAPRVVASGQGVIAEQILNSARENNIPIHEDAVLTAALAQVNLGDEIPPELYLVVAEVLAYIYRVSGKSTAP